MKHLLNNIGDSSTACGRGIEDLEDNKSITTNIKIVTCKDCLDNYDYWKYKLMVDTSPYSDNPPQTWEK